MRISKKGALEYFEKFAQEEDAAKCYTNNHKIIDCILRPMFMYCIKKVEKLHFMTYNVKTFHMKRLLQKMGICSIIFLYL